MRNLVKAKILVIAMLFAFTSMAYGAITVVARPDEVPAGAYVNGADGDHYFFQSVEFVLDGTVIATTEWLVELPDGITIADIDELNGIDEIYLQNVVAGATAAVLVIASPGASSFVVDITTLNNLAAGDKITALFPVETSTTLASGLTYTVTATNCAGSTPGTSNEVAIVRAVSVASFDGTRLTDAGDGKIQTNVRGTRHPDAGAGGLTYTAAMPNLLVDLVGGGAAQDATVNAVDNWLTGVASYENTADNDGEITFQLWASQSDSLARISDGTGQLAEDANTGAAFTAVNEAAAITSAAVATFGALNTVNLAEGNWFFYITSDISNGWVLGSSDTLEVRHHPAFIDISVAGTPVTAGALLGAGDGIDYDHDGTFEPKTAVGAGTGNGDDATATTLESGGTIGRDGLLVDAANNPSFDSVNVHWYIEDVDDNARIHVFRSTNSAWTVSDVTTSGGVVTGLGTATEVTTSAIYEEDPDNYATWKIYTNATTYETAGDYFLYIVAYDGTNLGFKRVGDQTGAALTVTVKHFPYFKFHDVYAAGGDGQTFDTATDQYLMLSWGETIDGDKDADAAGTAVIKLYVVDEAAGGSALYDDIVLGNDPTVATSLTNLQDNGTLLTTITDVSDTREANRYMYDLRSAGLSAATYSFWAHISHLSDNLVVQYNSGTNPVVPGASEDDRSFVVSHGSYLRPKTPYAGPPVELDQSDRFIMEWEAFDQDAAGTERVQACLVLEGSSANQGNAQWTVWDAVASDDIIWVVPTSDLGDNNANTDGTNTGRAIVDMTGVQTGAADGAFVTGNYDVYYFYSEDGTFDGDDFTVQAPGQVYLTGITTDPYDIELTPNRAHMSPGDILTVDIYATDDGTDTDKAVFSVIIPNASYFTLVDQDATTAGTQPFDNDLGAASPNALGGDVLMNTVGIVNGSYVLGYMEFNSGGAQDVTVAGGEDMVSFQLQMTSVLADPLEDIEIVFGTTDPNVTNFFDPDGSPQSTSVPPVALALKLGQSGKLTGVVDVEGRVDKNQVVDFYLVPTGSADPITTASYLSANGDADGSDGVQVTLQGGGYYELLGIPTGEYDVLVGKTRYANASRANVRISSLDNVIENFVGARKLLGGDAAGYVDTTGTNIPDNRINAEDTQAIADAGIGTTSADPTWNTYADIDESGTVDVNDLFMAAKNIGIDGGGIFYKEIPGTNEGALVWLALVEETAEGVTYAVRADKLSNLSAFSAKLLIGMDCWEVANVSDGLTESTRAIQLSAIRGAEAITASAVIGSNPVFTESMDLMTITLRPLASNPAKPSLTDVTLIDGNGVLAKGIISNEAEMLPKEFSLEQNFPNPFNPTTTIGFSLPDAGNVKLTVYNMLGQEVRSLVSGAMGAGSYKAVWDSRDNFGRQVTSGVYFYRLMVDNRVIATNKMVLLK